jgi:hypothetical protein
MARSLEHFRKIKYDQINQKSQDLIAKGFIYNSKVFSLSRYMQLNLANAVQLSNMQILTFPLTFSTIDDTGNEILSNPSMLNSFYAIAYGTVGQILTSGGDLKQQVREATTIQAIKTVQDNR